MQGDTRPEGPPQAPPDWVVFAVGEVNGRLDLLDAAIGVIEVEAEAAERVNQRVVAIFLGGYIDRGPDTNGVLTRLIQLQAQTAIAVVFLRGAREQTLLGVALGDEPGLAWLQAGGRETLASYGVTPQDMEDLHDDEDVRRLVNQRIPKAHLIFLRATRLHEEAGDYVFAHAGLRSDKPIADQTPADLLWVRYRDDERPVHGKVVVHGHAPNPGPAAGQWRIGIDTAAHASGDLTLLKLTGMRREFIRVRARNGAAAEVSTWPAAEKLGRRPAAGRKSRSVRQGALPFSPGRVALVCGGLSLLALSAVLGYGLLRAQPKPPPAPAQAVAAAPPPPAAAPAPTPAPVQPQPAAATPPQPAPPPSGGELKPTQPAPASTTSDGLRRAAPPPTPAAAAPKPPPPKPAPAAAPKPVAPAPKAAPAGPRAQIGALDSAALAERAFRDLKAAMPSAMASASLEVEPVVTSKGATLYRAYARFPTEAGARALCVRMREAGRACILRLAPGG